LVPDPPGVLTSNAGWNIHDNNKFLQNIIAQIQDFGVRTSLFLGTEINQLEMVKDIGADRIELYTGPFAENYTKNKELAVIGFVLMAQKAKELGIGVNAGHDLSLDNLAYLINRIPFIDEVSIGHALISDALYLGLENTIQRYLLEIEKGQLNY
jgi:pyridoxine 5-phosphate synthase